MGRKRNGTGKRFYIFIACLGVAVLSGCAALKDVQARSDTLDAGRRLFDSGDYDGALKEYAKVIAFCRSAPPGDEALFYTGLIYAHQDYAKNDEAKSLEQFKKLVRGFSHSPYALQAQIWIGVLQASEKRALEAAELTKSLKKAHYDHERLTREIDDLKRTIKKSKEVDIEIDGKKKELSK